MANQQRAVAALRKDPQVVRAELAQTRARLSHTIDEIEDVILDKKEELIATAKGIRQRLDPFHKAREKPLAAIGVVFGAGLVVGVLTKGGKKKAAAALVEAVAAAPPPAPERSDLWESRARRLLRIAREQQGELAELRGGGSDWEQADDDEPDDDDYFDPDDDEVEDDDLDDDDLDEEDDDYDEESDEEEDYDDGSAHPFRDRLRRFGMARG